MKTYVYIQGDLEDVRSSLGTNLDLWVPSVPDLNAIELISTYPVDQRIWKLTIRRIIKFTFEVFFRGFVHVYKEKEG